MRAFHGLFHCLSYQTYYTYFIESLTIRQRSRLGALPDILTGVSPCLNALIAYYARDWRVQIYIIGALNGASIFLLWFLPKSEKWLAAQKAGSEKTDKWEQMKVVLKGNLIRFKMITGSSPVMRVMLIMVRCFFGDLIHTYPSDDNSYSGTVILDGN